MNRKLKQALAEIHDKARSNKQRLALLDAVDMAIEEARDTGYLETASCLQTVRGILVLYNAGIITISSQQAEKR